MNSPPYSSLCDQSASAWPVTVSQDLGFSASYFSFRACTGAELTDQNGTPLGDLTGPEQVTNAITKQILGTWPAQENTLNSGTRLVTLTWGGNDVGFVPVLAACVTSQLCQYSVGPALDTKIANIGHTLVQAYEEIARLAPNATILVMGYPRFFPQNPPPLCYTGFPPFTFNGPQMTWMNGEIQKMDNQIQTAVTTADNGLPVKNILYVNAYDAFTGHELCTADPYLNNFVGSDASFHPNGAGNEALAQLAETYIGTILPVDVRVPKVIGLLAADAISTIRSAGLVPIEVSFVDTTCNTIGYVINQSPQAWPPEGHWQAGHHHGRRQATKSLPLTRPARQIPRPM